MGTLKHTNVQRRTYHYKEYIMYTLLDRADYDVFRGMNGLWYIVPVNGGCGWHDLTAQQKNEVLRTKFFSR